LEEEDNGNALWDNDEEMNEGEATQSEDGDDGGEDRDEDQEEPDNDKWPRKKVKGKSDSVTANRSGKRV